MNGIKPVLDNSLILLADPMNTKSNPSEPTINLLYNNGTFSDNFSIMALGGGIFSSSNITANKYRLTSQTLNEDSLRMYVPLSNLVYGYPYNLSYNWAIVSGSGTFSMNDWNDILLTNRVDINYGTYAFSSACGSGSFGGYYDTTYRFMDFNMSDNMVVDMWNIQLEVKTHSSTFVTGSRGVYNLKNNNNIELYTLTSSSTIMLPHMYSGNYPIGFNFNTYDYGSYSSSDFLFGTGDFTIDVWVYPKSFSGYGHIFTISDQLYFTLKFDTVADSPPNGGKIYFYTGTPNAFDTYDSTPTWVAKINTWNHIVFKRSSNVAYAYLNGVAAGSKAGFNNNFNQYTQSYIHKGWGEEYAPSTIGAIKVYNRALTDTEISINFNATRKRYNV